MRLNTLKNANNKWKEPDRCEKNAKMVELALLSPAMSSRVQVRISCIDKVLQIADLRNKLKCLVQMAKILRLRACSVHRASTADAKPRIRS